MATRPIPSDLLVSFVALRVLLHEEAELDEVVSPSGRVDLVHTSDPHLPIQILQIPQHFFLHARSEIKRVN